jgi:diamine N-acetyltransferase
MLSTEKILLRMVEPEDATKLLIWENNPENWKVTDTEVPFSMHAIKMLIEQQQQIRSTGQLRMMICLNDNSEEPIGAIDLYDVDFKNKNASVGILIGDKMNRGKGYAKDALEIIIKYALNNLSLHNLVCSIQATNIESIRLFESMGFEKIGRRKEWFLIRNNRVDEILYQLCLEKK